jgi:hypothetical protein
MTRSSEPRKEPRRRATTPRTRTKGGTPTPPASSGEDTPGREIAPTPPPASDRGPTTDIPPHAHRGAQDSPEPRQRLAAPAGEVPDHDAIARRAYEIYSSRGARDGSALDDWLRAERELGEQRRAS